MTLPKGASATDTNRPRLWLASASSRRLDLLAQIGVVPDRVGPADIDETPLPRETPRGLAGRLALEKARAVLADISGNEDWLILAADTVVAAGRRILPKAETAATARDCLALLSGRAHRVYGGVCVLYKGKVFSRIVGTRVMMKKLSEEEIRTYLESGEWQGKAGGYAIQGRAGAFVKSLNGSYANVVGLPLYETSALLRGAGFLAAKLGNEEGEAHGA